MSLVEKMVISGETAKLENGFISVVDIVTKLGLSNSLVSISQTILRRFMQDVLIAEGPLSTYLKVIKSSEDQFHFRFMEMSSYLAAQLASELDAPFKNEYLDQVVFAAMFADITLRKSEWIHIRSSEQLKGMSGVMVKEINMHALKASELVAHSSLAPKGSAQVIKRHHGDINGLCFSDAADEQMCVLSKCLMVAQEVAYAILMHPQSKPRTVLAEVVVKHGGTPLSEMLEKLEGRCCPHYVDKKTA